ncbi:MAG: hypothetical protein WAP57_15210, partial [Aquabacterium commune]|uniref:hypothetical protein n=1 Tax=Aquabacterium commune TaxID=70586 RepID=UPI003BAEADD1
LQGGLDATAGLAGATGEALVVHANAFAAAGTTTGASGKRLTVATLTDGAAIAVNVPGGSGLQLSAATLGALSGFNTITLGRSDSNSAIAVQNITLPAHLVLEAGAADVTVSGTVQGAGWGLSVRSAGLTTLAGSLLGLGSIDTDAGGSTEIATDVNTSGAQTYRDAVSLTGPAGGVRGLRASELAFLDGLAVGDRDLALRTDALTLSGVSVSGGHTLTLSAMTAGRDILLNRAGAGLSLDAAALARLSVFSGVTVGGSDADGAILADNLTLPTAMTLRTRFGEIALSGTTDAQSWALTVQTFANVTVSGSLVRLPRLDLSAATLRLETATGLTLGNLTLSAGDSVVRSAGVLTLAGDIVLNGGSLLLRSDVTPTVLSTFTSPEHAGQFRTVGVSTVLAQASNGIVQSAGRIVTAAGSHLALRTTAGASIDVGGAANELGGTVSAVSGDIAENLGTPRLTTPGPDGKVVAGFLNLRANQLNVAGRPVDNSDQALLRAGLEADVVALQADRIQTATHNGLIRARLPYDNNQGTLTAMPALTLTVSASGLGGGASYGGIELGQRIAVSIGGSAGGYVTVRPRRGISLGSGYVSLGGEEALRPFYDGNGDLSAVPLFYNGLAPQSAQAVGALSAVTAVIEEARRARFEEAVRTENVASRLRTGVIAEVGAGRPATEGSDTLALPQACTPAGESLRCE